MKKIILFLAILCFAVLNPACSSNTTIEEGYETLRIRVLSDSYDDIDQQVRAKVVSEVKSYAVRLLSGASSYGEALKKVNANLDEIDRITKRAIVSGGRTYAEKAELKTEYFPTRAYGSVVVESGYYQSLTITLGRGGGDNWWCVLYPPLCADESVVYKSRVGEWLGDLFGRPRPSSDFFGGIIGG